MRGQNACILDRHSLLVSGFGVPETRLRQSCRVHLRLQVHITPRQRKRRRDLYSAVCCGHAGQALAAGGGLKENLWPVCRCSHVSWPLRFWIEEGPRVCAWILCVSPVSGSVAAFVFENKQDLTALCAGEAVFFVPREQRRQVECGYVVGCAHFARAVARVCGSQHDRSLQCTHAHGLTHTRYIPSSPAQIPSSPACMRSSPHASERACLCNAVPERPARIRGN